MRILDCPRSGRRFGAITAQNGNPAAWGEIAPQPCVSRRITQAAGSSGWLALQPRWGVARAHRPTAAALRPAESCSGAQLHPATARSKGPHYRCPQGGKWPCWSCCASTRCANCRSRPGGSDPFAPAPLPEQHLGRNATQTAGWGGWHARQLRLPRIDFHGLGHRPSPCCWSRAST